MQDNEHLKELEDFNENTHDDFNTHEKSNNENDDSILKRDKFLLDMMIHAYEEDEHRNTLVDSKNSQMIGIIGVMLTIQGSFFTYLFSQFSKINLLTMNIILSVLALISLGYYVYSMKIFIDSYNFKTFKSVPNPEYLVNSAKKNSHEHNIVADLLGTFCNTIKYNKEVISNKINISKEGFEYFKKGGLVTVLFILVFLLTQISIK